MFARKLTRMGESILAVSKQLDADCQHCDAVSAVLQGEGRTVVHIPTAVGDWIRADLLCSFSLACLSSCQSSPNPSASLRFSKQRDNKIIDEQRF